MNMVNCTPHALTLRSHDGTDTVLLPSGLVPRVTSTPGHPTMFECCPVPVYTAETFGRV